MVMVIVKFLPGEIIVCRAGKLSSQLTGIEDDPVPCPHRSHDGRRWISAVIM
jgi:hypothetical protein